MCPMVFLSAHHCGRAASWVDKPDDRAPTGNPVWHKAGDLSYGGRSTDAQNKVSQLVEAMSKHLILYEMKLELRGTEGHLQGLFQGHRAP